MSRTVKIQVFGTAEGWLQGLALESTDSAVKSALQSAGWNVESVNLSGSGVGSTREGAWLDIYTNVDDQYTQADIEQSIVSSLAGTFDVSQISVNDPNAGTAGAANTGASGLPAVNGQGGLFGNLGAANDPLGLGISTTTLLIIAAGVYLLVNRR